jgi:short-subunit dehydrogenase
VEDDMKRSLDGSRVLLTGASSGIGRELALVLAGRGARLAVAARRREPMEQLGAEAVIECDLSVRGAAAALAVEAQERLGGIDVLVNNAGGGVGGQIARVGDHDAAREAFEVNYWSPLALIKELVPGMATRGEGTIVNVSSMAQVSSWPGFGAYAATKGAFGVATETLRMELAPAGIGVLEVLPGPVDTAVQGETRLAPGIERMLGRLPLGDPVVLARMIADAIERGRLRVIYPRLAAIGYLLPALARRDARRLAAKAAAELDAPTREALGQLLVRTGSQGDEIARQARDAWERERGRAPA